MRARSPSPNPESDRARDRYAPMRQGRARHLTRTCVLAAAFVESEGPRSFAHSQVDYARGVLGARPADFKRWVRAGRLLRSSPPLKRSFVLGRLSFATVDLLARSRRPASWIELALPLLEGRSSREARALLEDRDPDPPNASSIKEEPTHGPKESPVGRFHLRLPAPADAYVEDTLRLARAMLGAELSDEACIEAILAEASSEITPTHSVEVARRRLRRHCGTSRFARGDAHPAPVLAPPRSERTARTPRPLPQTERSRKRRARRLHALLTRQLARWRRHESRRDEELLDLLQQGVHARWGFRRFQDFCAAVLDLPASTAFDRIRRARRRRSGDALTLARVEGQIGAVQADLLERLHRRTRVPLADLPAWIDFAAAHTTRRLREACAWAEHRSTVEHRAWSLEGHPPPTTAQLRTLNSSLEQILATDADPEAWVAQARTSPWVDRSFTLESELLDLLLQLVAALDLPRPWLGLCRLCALARSSWAQHVELHLLPGRRRRVLERDGWRCRAPECASRRNLQVHHVHYRSRGGGDDESNLVTLCAFHHLVGEHAGLLRVRPTGREEFSAFRWEMGLDELGRPALTYVDERLVQIAAQEEPPTAAAIGGR